MRVVFTCTINVNKLADIFISFYSVYQRAIYSLNSDHKFGFLSDFPCVHELWFMFKLFSLLYQIICLQGRWVDWRDSNICDGNLKNDCFCDYLQVRFWRTVCSLCCAKIIGSKNLAFIYRDGMEHVLIPTITVAHLEDRWRKKFTKSSSKHKFFF